jgi:large subunit ribosomal protein L9
MKVLLQQDVKGQGKKGEVVELSDGYARNYLFPRKLAVEATKDVLNAVSIKEKAKKEAEEREKERLRALAKSLETMVTRIPAKAGASGKLFGAVTAKEISEELNRQHSIDIDRRKIVLDEPIKVYGSFQVTAKLGYDIVAVIMINVTEG